MDAVENAFPLFFYIIPGYFLHHVSTRIRIFYIMYDVRIRAGDVENTTESNFLHHPGLFSTSCLRYGDEALLSMPCVGNIESGFGNGIR